MKKSKRELELEELTYSLVPTPVSLLVSLGKEKANQMQDTSGQTLLGLSKSANRLGLLEKTLVDTLNSVSIPYSRIWKLRVTTQGHLLFQLQLSELGTDENEYGLSDIKNYPTPTVDDSKVVNPKDNRRKGLVKQVNLEQNRKTGGKLNPNFVEFLMGFPMDWTKVESEESKD